MKAHELKKIVFFSLIAVFASFSSSLCRAEMLLEVDQPSINLGVISKQDLNVGYKEIGDTVNAYALRFTISNPDAWNWTLETRAETPYFSANSGMKPCGDLAWRIDSLDMYNPFTITDAVIQSGNSISTTVDIDLKLSTSWFDTPDRYAIRLVFTLYGEI
ncbi:MAG TPA: hypothetical protein PLQ76_09370 [bacterium]|nr:hypothetical protein [bacterium]